MTLTLLPLGTGDAFSAEHHSCCHALLCDGEVLLVDCPHPIRKVMRDAAEISGVRIDVADVRACVLTHLHADHASGVEGLLWFARFALGKKATLALHDDVRARLWDGHLAAGMEQLLEEGGRRRALTLADVADCVSLAEHTPTTLGPFVLEVRRTIHHIPTFAVRVRADGASVAFSADTAWDEGLLAWLLEADLVVHEAGHGPAHTPLDRLAALPAEVRARVRLTHLGDHVDRDTLPIPALTEGVPLDIAQFRALRSPR